MTVHEAAKILEVSPDLVYRLCRAGRLGHRRVGLRRGVIRIEREDVDAFLAETRVEPGPAPEAGGPRRDVRPRREPVPSYTGKTFMARRARAAKRKARAEEKEAQAAKKRAK